MVIIMTEKGISVRGPSSTIVFQWHASRPDSLSEPTDSEIEDLIESLLEAGLEEDEIALFVLKRYSISSDRLRGLIMMVVAARNLRRQQLGLL